jgi:hypothetical protein
MRNKENPISFPAYASGLTLERISSSSLSSLSSSPIAEELSSIIEKQISLRARALSKRKRIRVWYRELIARLMGDKRKDGKVKMYRVREGEGMGRQREI